MTDQADPEMLEEYDFSGGRRGVYAERYAQGTNLIVLPNEKAAEQPQELSPPEIEARALRLGL